MNPSVGSWWPVVASAELGRKPISRMRFGEPLVFWRHGDEVVCMADRCPHRGAALSLGRGLSAGSIDLGNPEGLKGLGDNVLGVERGHGVHVARAGLVDKDIGQDH